MYTSKYSCLDKRVNYTPFWSITSVLWFLNGNVILKWTQTINCGNCDHQQSVFDGRTVILSDIFFSCHQQSLMAEGRHFLQWPWKMSDCRYKKTNYWWPMKKN